MLRDLKRPAASKMHFSALKLFVLLLVIYEVSAGRYRGSSSRGSSRGSGSSGGSRGGGWGGSRGGSSSSGSKWPTITKTTASRPSYTQPSRPSNTHHDTGKKSTDFIHAEGGGAHRASAPNLNNHNSNNNNNHGSSYPSNHGSNTHSTYPKINENIQKNSNTPVHSSSSGSEYNKQPAYNPAYVPSGGYGGNFGNSGPPKPPAGISVPTVHNTHSSSPNSPPYPVGLPQHPHPQSGPVHTPISSPVNVPHVNSAAPGHYPGMHSGPTHYPSVASAPPGISYPSVYHGGAPQPHYPVGGSYHPGGHMGGYGGYHPQAAPSYAPSYHSAPPTQAFVPGRTVIVEKPSKGPGIGSFIAGGVATGVAAGATNAIVDHAISSIFRPSSSHVHTYPSAPPVGTPTSTVTHTTNNFYYGNSGPGDAPNNNNNNNGPSPNNNNEPNNYNGNGNSNGNNNNNNYNNGPGPNNNNDPNNNNNYNPNNGPSQGFNGGAGAPQNQASSGGVSNPVITDTRMNPLSTTNGVVSKTPDVAPPPENKDNPLSDENIMKLTEELFEAQDKNLYPFVDLHLQTRATGPQGEKVPDQSPDRLFSLKSELDSIPTITALKALYDNHERDGSKPENLTPERQQEESNFIDEVVKTPVMTKAMDWLVSQNYVEPKDSEKKDTLRRMWFSTFDNTSSGFERIFLSERFGDNGIVGMQNWLYFAHLESQDKVNYLSYVDVNNLGGKGALLKLNYLTEGFTMQNATIFVGTPPELELALYTVCFYARPNNWCPVSLGGSKFFILTHLFRYYQKDLIDLGFPAF